MIEHEVLSVDRWEHQVLELGAPVSQLMLEESDRRLREAQDTATLTLAMIMVGMNQINCDKSFSVLPTSEIFCRSCLDRRGSCLIAPTSTMARSYTQRLTE